MFITLEYAMLSCTKQYIFTLSGQSFWDLYENISWQTCVKFMYTEALQTHSKGCNQNRGKLSPITLKMRTTGKHGLIHCQRSELGFL